MADAPLDMTVAQPCDEESVRHPCPRTRKEQQLVTAYRMILSAIDGEDPHRQGLQDTPARAAKAMLEMTAGYAEDPQEIARGALFGVDAQGAPTTSPQGLVLIRDIKIHSLCEHHLLRTAF